MLLVALAAAEPPPPVAPGAPPRGAGAGLVAHAPASQIEKATQATRGMPRV